MDQYRASQAGGVYYEPAGELHVLPVARSQPMGIAHSGSQVADVSACPGSGNYCEFSAPASTGKLVDAARTVTMYPGVTGSNGYPAAHVTLTALDAGGATIVASTATVTQGQPFNVPLSVTTPSPVADIAAFRVSIDSNQPLAYDDLTITRDDAPSPPDFGLGVPPDPANVRTGDTLEVPIGVNRLNGSNGDINFSVTGAPTGMSATVVPNPVPGATTAATLKLTAAASAAASDQYSEITITATPTSGAGPTPRTVRLLVPHRRELHPDDRTDFIDARTFGCARRARSERTRWRSSTRTCGSTAWCSRRCRATATCSSTRPRRR